MWPKSQARSYGARKDRCPRGKPLLAGNWAVLTGLNQWCLVSEKINRGFHSHWWWQRSLSPASRLCYFFRSQIFFSFFRWGRDYSWAHDLIAVIYWSNHGYSTAVCFWSESPSPGPSPGCSWAVTNLYQTCPKVRKSRDLCWPCVYELGMRSLQHRHVHSFGLLLVDDISGFSRGRIFFFPRWLLNL